MDDMTAGLLACDSVLNPSPSQVLTAQWQMLNGELAAHSCGYSHGIDLSLTVFPFKPPAGYRHNAI